MPPCWGLYFLCSCLFSFSCCELLFVVVVVVVVVIMWMNDGLSTYCKHMRQMCSITLWFKLGDSIFFAAFINPTKVTWGNAKSVSLQKRKKSLRCVRFASFFLSPWVHSLPYVTYKNAFLNALCSICHYQHWSNKTKQHKQVMIFILNLLPWVQDPDDMPILLEHWCDRLGHRVIFQSPNIDSKAKEFQSVWRKAVRLFTVCVFKRNYLFISP